MHTVIGACHARERVKKDKHIFLRFHHATAPLDHEARQAHVGFQVLIVRRCDDLGLDRTLKISDLLGAFVNQEHHDVHFRMVGRYGIGNLFEDGRLAGAGWSDDQTACAFSQRGDQINNARFQQVWRRLQLKFLGRVNGGQVLKPHRFGVIVESQSIDLVHFAQLRARAPVRGLERAGHQRAFAQEVLFDGVGRDEDVRRFGLKMVVRRAEESEPFFGDFQISGTIFRCAIRLGAHRSTVLCLKGRPKEWPLKAT